MAERSVSVRLSANVAPYLAAMRSAQSATTGMAGATQVSLTSVGVSMQTVGRNLTRYVSLPVLAAGAAAVSAAVSWESAWAGVTKTVDGTTEQLATLQQGLRDMASEVPASHAEIAAVAEAAGALGVATEDVLAFTRVMVDLGETTNLTSDAAATAIAQFMNVMGTASGDVDELASTLVHLGNTGASTEAGILELAQRLAGAGQVIGLTEVEVLSMAAAMADLGIEAQLGGGAMSRVMTAMNSAVAAGGDKLKTFAEVAGMTTSEFATAFSEAPMSAITAFIDGLGRLDDAGGDVAGVLKDLGLNSSQVRDVMNRMMGDADGLTDALNRGRQAWSDNNALTEEAAKRYETAGAQFEMVRNKIVDLFIDLGAIILPAVSAIVDVIGILAEQFQKLPAPVQAVVGGFLGLSAALGPIIFLGGSMVKNWSSIFAVLGKVGPAAKTAGLAFGALGVAVAAGFLIYQSFTSKQRELEERTREVGGALAATSGDVFRYALEAAGAETAVVGLAAANEALSSALVSAGDDGAKLLDSLGALGRQGSEAGAILLAFGRDAGIALLDLGMQAGLTAAQAAQMARIVNSTDDSFEVAAQVTLKLGAEYVDLALAMEEVQDQANKTDLDKVAAAGLRAAAAASEHSDQLIRQAEAMLGLEEGVGRFGDQATDVWFKYGELLATADQETQDAVLSTEGYQEALDLVTGAAEGAGEGVTGATKAIKEWATVAASTIDTTSGLRDYLDALAMGWDTMASSLDEALGHGGDWMRAHDDYAGALDDLSEGLDHSTHSLDWNTDAGRQNRSAIYDMADGLVEMTRANLQSGKSQAETTEEYLAGREALLDAAEAAGLNRADVEALITTYGLVPDLVSTTFEIGNDALAKWQTDRYIAKLEEIPEHVVVQIDTLIQENKYDEAWRLIRLFTDTDWQAWVELNSNTYGAEMALNWTSRVRGSPVIAEPDTVSSEYALGWTSRRRGAPVEAEPATASAESALNWTSRYRGAPITASAATSSAESALNWTSRNRFSTIYVSTSVSGGGGMQYMAAGGYADRPKLSVWGEAGAEAMFPLTRPNRIRELWSDPRISGPMMAALKNLSPMSPMSMSAYMPSAPSTAPAASNALPAINVYNNGREITDEDIARAIRKARVHA